MIPKRTQNALLLVASAVAMTIVWGCTENDVLPPNPPRYISPRTLPWHVLNNLKEAYKFRNEEEYAKFLAEDFRFFFDPETRTDKPELPEWWNRFTDSTQTAKVFKSIDVVDIRIELTYNPNAESVNELGREHWKLITVGDEKLEVDLRAEPGAVEGITLLVDGQIQKFYFRLGKSEADTLPESETAKEYFLTEWRDLGTGAP